MSPTVRAVLVALKRRVEGRVAPSRAMSIRIGLAMLQGARHEHAQAIVGAAEELGIDAEIKVLRTSGDLDGGIDALILPGGESTTMRIASRHQGLLESLYEWMNDDPQRPVLGTCAGAILMCSPPSGPPLLDAEISRNAWGRQAKSFQAPVAVFLDVEVVPPAVTTSVSTDAAHHPLVVSSDGLGDGETFPGVFIRAPRFSSIGTETTVVAEFDGEVVGILQGGRLALTFHPELTSDRRFHRWIISQAAIRAAD
jgi:5'-phosphate synthase pdxT subunit